MAEKYNNTTILASKKKEILKDFSKLIFYYENIKQDLHQVNSKIIENQSNKKKIEALYNHFLS